MIDSIDDIFNKISQIKVNAKNGEKSPHKFIFLLTLAKLYKDNEVRDNKFPLNDELEEAFQHTWLLYLGEEANYNAIEYPYYHLQSDGIWILEIKEDKVSEYTFYKETPNRRLTKNRIQEIVDFGYLIEEFHEHLKNENTRNSIVNYIIEQLGGIGQDTHQKKTFSRLNFNKEINSIPNPFVAYLNSLHCREAGSENSLAESQACNPWFGLIQIPHPLLPNITNCLLGDEPRHVIITGHAGDGKSIIALELYKSLKNIAPDQPLDEPLQMREDISLDGCINITIIKDLSEWGDKQRDELFAEILSGNKRFLLVSNTGTLLDSFCSYGLHHLGLTRAEIEPIILEAISSQQFYPLNFGNNQFDVINLALLDNLSIARQVFYRMLAPDRWIACQSKECHNDCPIYLNVSLIQEHQDIVLTRLFLAYRRMYEYGTRLTLRQLIAHLAYMLTSGLEYADIIHLSLHPEEPLMSEFMFYNRFFGDNGKEDDFPALQMRAVKEIRKQGFGERPCPTWERQLWLLTQTKHFTLGIPSIENEFDELRKYGSGGSNIEDDQLTPDQARDQVRRILFFLYKFPKNDDLFIKHFLSSPAVLKWWSWQNNDARLSLDESGSFKQRVFHVLQEQFTGVRLPESNSADQNLYITLSRHKHEIRQSAQVVLAQIDFGNEFSLELVQSENDWGEKRNDLCLLGRGRLKGVNMPLTLPFLDYVLMRHCGETGEVLQSAYVNRLERLKAQLLKLADRAQNDDILLVRILTNHTFFRQNYVVHNNRLEVANGQVVS